MPKTMKRIIHIDDHLLFAEGIKLLFEGHKEYKLEDHFTNTTDAISYCNKNIPDLMLMDYYLPEGNGLDAAEPFMKFNPKPKIIFLSMVNDHFIIQAAQLKGINGFLSKNIGHEALFSAIDAIFKGESCFKSINTENDSNPGFLHLLSKREKQIAKLVAKGYSTPKIASTLFISELTVSTHRKNIIRKLNLENSVQLGKYIDLFN
jgi:DNA-binding NarL/FixJ family response regulator